MKSLPIDRWLSKFSTQKVLVVGDIMLDQFVWGKVSRISPEAPIPVVEVIEESLCPGGAANVALNIKALGGQAEVVGLIGDDLQGKELLRLLKEHRIDTEGVVVERMKPTTLKTRIIAHKQHVVRVDRESVERPSADSITNAVEYIREHIEEFHAVLVQDYDKGFLTQKFVDAISQLARKHKKILAIDPKPSHPLRFKNPTFIKPNRTEAFRWAGIKEGARRPSDPLQDGELLKAGSILMQKWKPDMLLITLGEQGMILFQQNEKPHHIPTVAHEVSDVSGAGDTTLAAFSLGLLSGATPEKAAEIANHAAGVVVGKLGTATVSPEELRESFRNHS